MMECGDCRQKGRNDEQDKRIEKMEAVVSRNDKSISQMERDMEESRKEKDKLAQKDDQIEEKLGKAEQTMEAKIRAEIKDLSENLDKRMNGLENKMWGFIIAVLFLAVTILLRT